MRYLEGSTNHKYKSELYASLYDLLTAISKLYKTH